jgi:sRNA-binding carbon storage regulator CsrA
MLRIYRQEGQEIVVRYGDEPREELVIKLCNLDFHRKQAQIGIQASPEVLIFRAEHPRTKRDREEERHENNRD